MMRQILTLFFIICLSQAIPFGVAQNVLPQSNKAWAEDAELKINSINFDNSDSIIFLGTSGQVSPENIKIIKKTLANPDRTFFDIENAAITFPNETYTFQNSKLQKVVIAQNSTSPNVVRVVLWNSANYNSENIKVLNIKNNIIIKLNNAIPQQPYQTQVYRESGGSSADYIDKTVIFQNTEPKKESDEIFNKVQQAFKENSQELVRPNIEQKQAKLKSRFFAEKAYVQNGNLLLSGIGVVNIAKPFVLKEPSRIVYDLPNTILQQELREKEFTLQDGTTIKLGQFTPSTARIVIKTENTNAYIPVYSRNLQTILIGNAANLNNFVTSAKSELTYFKENHPNASTDVINIAFSNPVIYSIKHNENKIDVTFYNLVNFNVNSFNALAVQNKTGYIAKQLSSNVYRISFPTKANTLADCYESLNASQLRFVITRKTVAQVTHPTQITVEKPAAKTDTTVKSQPKKETVKQGLSIDNLIEKQNQKKTQSKVTKNSKNKTTVDVGINKIKNKIIVIDPGHGGNDTGALRNNVLEKDLTLQIALKVRDILKAKGFTNIIMTRATDKTLTLQERVQIANSNKANVYVSIHINASVKSEVKGVETHYYNEGGYDVAQTLHKELMKKLTVTDRGLFKSKFYVINHTEAPAVLLELGFISNEQERNLLTSEQRQMDSAQAIANGIIEYLMEH